MDASRLGDAGLEVCRKVSGKQWSIAGHTQPRGEHQHAIGIKAGLG